MAARARPRQGHPDVKNPYRNNPIIERLFTQKNGKHVYLIDGKGNVQRVEANIKPLEGTEMYELITKSRDPIYKTLEVGCAGGTSAMYITQAIIDRYKKNPAELTGEAPVPDPPGAETIDETSFPTKSQEHTHDGNTVTLEVSAPIKRNMTAATEIRAKGGIHIAVDPFQMTAHTGVPENEKGWDGLGMFNIYQSGAFPMVELVAKKSHEALPQILGTYGPGSFDFIFIDGMHLYDYTLVDMFYSAMLLRKGGYLVVDDVLHPSVNEVKWYFDDNYPHFKNRHSARVRTIGIWEKTDEDTRKWSFHCSVCKNPSRIKDMVARNNQTRKNKQKRGNQTRRQGREGRQERDDRRRRENDPRGIHGNTSSGNHRGRRRGQEAFASSSGGYGKASDAAAAGSLTWRDIPDQSNPYGHGGEGFYGSNTLPGDEEYPATVSNANAAAALAAWESGAAASAPENPFEQTTALAAAENPFGGSGVDPDVASTTANLFGESSASAGGDSGGVDKK